jgi:replicative DNA helicase Mcm
MEWQPISIFPKQWNLTSRAVRDFFQRCNDNGLVERKVENSVTYVRLTERAKNNITRILGLRRLIENGHLAFAEVREIEIVNPTSPYVYDVSTPNYENFIAGVGGVICHNTAAGLTAAVVREKAGGLVLEAGALVLSDKGICSIDEFDKMKPEDRVAIHEVMEQQTVSVAKGGIVATLNARSSILAAANPALGRYDPYRTVAENINLPVTVLSRFDLIFVLKDVPQRETDTKMSEHILGLHKTGSTPVEPPIPPQLLRKYIAYAKRVKPVLSDEAMKRFEEFYLRMRAASESRESPIAITPRQLESLVRLAEARARAALRSEVSAEDAEAVIALVKKSLEQVGIDVTTGKYDIDIIMTGKPKTLRDRLTEVLTTIVSMEKETGMVKLEDLYDRLMKDYEIDKTEADRLISQLTREGTIYSPKLGYLKKT